MNVRIAVAVSIAAMLAGCGTSGGFHASAAMNTQGLALYEQGRYPQASAVFKRCLEVEQNPACLHNIGMMIENSRYNDPDPKVREAMWADGKTPRGRAVQYYVLAARYGQEESIDALNRLGREVPAVDLSPPTSSGRSDISPATAQALVGLAGIVGCMLGGGNNCALAAGSTFATPTQQQRPSETRTATPTSSAYRPIQLQSRQTPAPITSSLQQASVQTVRATTNAPEACVLNTDCQYPASCVKAPGSRTGTCAVEVDSAGDRTFQRTGQGVGCTYDYDCGDGFYCRRDRATARPGVCVKD